MKNYKIITTPTTTRYVLESATAGATSAGSVASTEQPMGNIITREADKNKVPQKPRQGPLRPQTGGGKHKDKKRAEKQGDIKHKKPFMEDHEVSMASNELKSIHANAKKLLALVQQYGEQGDIEAWQQSKITKAADYLNSVLQSIGGEQDALDELKGDPNRPDSKKISHFQNLLKTQKDRFAQQGFARAADDTDKLQKKYREPISELDRPSGTMFLKFMKKQLPDREMALYAFAGFGNTPDDVRSANAKIKPFIVGDVDELEYNVNKIFRDVDFVGVEKMVVDARNVPDGMMPDVEALVDLDDRLEFYVDDSDDDEQDGGGGKMQHYVIGPDGRKRKVPVPGKPSAQVAGSSHNTPVQPKTYKYTLQRTELMPKLRDMGFKFQGNQIILSKQQRDQLVQKLGSQFQSIFSQSDKFTEAGNERNKQNPTRDFLRRYPVSDKDVAKPVKKPEKKKDDGRKQQFRGTGGLPPTDDDGNVLEQVVAEGSGKNVVKSVKVGNFRHDLVDTGMGWQVRIYNGDELYDTGMSKNSEQKGLAALEDAVAYTEKQTRTKRQGVAEASWTAAASMHAATRKRDPQSQDPKHNFRVGDVVTTKDGKSGKVVFVDGEKIQVKGTNSYYPDRVTHHTASELKKGVAEGKEELHSQLQSINQKLKLMRGGPVGEPNSISFVKKRQELQKQKEQILSQLKQGVAEAKGKLTYTPEPTEYGVFPDSKNEFVKTYLSKDLALAHIKKFGGKLVVLDQYGRRMKQGVAEGSLETDNMVSTIGWIIQNIYPRGGDKNTYMKLVAREMPHVVRDHPKLFRRAFGMAYDKFFHIDQDDDQDDDFDYTDYSMRQGERGMEEEKQKGVDGKACWKGYKRMGTKKKDGRTVDNCVKVGEDAYMESLWSQLDEYKFTSLPYKGQKKEKKAPYALGSKHIGKGKETNRAGLSGIKANTQTGQKPVVDVEENLAEKAPPGDKYERMVKHIKKGYSKDGKITDKERSIAYATAWKAKNKAKK